MTARIELASPTVAVRPGGAEATTRVTVRNDGAAIEAFALDVSGEAAGWATVEPATISVPGGAASEAVVVFRLPRSTPAATGTLGFAVRVRSASDPAGATAEGTLEILGVAELSAQLQRSHPRGLRTATVALEISNQGSAPARVMVGADESGPVEIEADPETLVVDSLTSESVKLRVRAPERALFGRRRSVPFAVGVEPLGGAVFTVRGTMQQSALLAVAMPWVLGAAAALLIIATALDAVIGPDAGDDRQRTDVAATLPPIPTTAATATARDSAASSETTAAAATSTTTVVAAGDRPIVFQTNREGNFEIYSMRPDGRDTRNITNNAGHDGEPALSPAGTRVAFDSDRDGGQGEFEIYLMNVDGTDIVRLTNSPRPDGYPTWSPDSAALAFVSFRDGNSELYVMNADGTGVRRLTRTPSDDANPAWSPDGTKIAFQSNRTGDYEIFTMNADDGSQVTQLTFTPGADTDPAWSPDGKRLAFDSSRDGDVEIYVMQSDGTAPIRVTESPGRDYWPAWSADGRSLAFVSRRDGDDELYAVPVAGGSPRRLTSTPGIDSEPSW